MWTKVNLPLHMGDCRLYGNWCRASKKKSRLPCDLVIPLLDISPKNSKTTYYRDSCTAPTCLFFIKNMLFENALSVLSLICNYIISMYVSVVADAEWESFNTLPYSYV